MHIALCVPISLDLFDSYVDHCEPMPVGFSFPYAFFLTMKLLAAGHQVTVVTSAYDVPTRKVWTGMGGLLTLISTPRRRPRWHCMDVYRREVKAMRRELERADPDVVHGHWTYEFADAALSTGLPCVITAHDAPWLIAKHFKQFYRFYRALYSSLGQVPRIRNITYVSPHIQNQYRKEPFFKPLSQSVIPNGLSSEFYAAEPRKGLHSAELPCFVSVTAWGRLKNVSCLLRAFPKVRARCPGAVLILVGHRLGVGEAGHLWAKANLLTDNVDFRGMLSYRDMFAVLEREADIAVYTTREESFSMSTLEAMAQGLPVIGGKNSGGVPWLLDQGAAGVVVDIEDPDAIAAAMLALADDMRLYKSVAQSGFQRAVECFTLDVVSRQYMAVYDQVVKPSAQGQ